jgi:hypothetical protein
VKLADVGEAYPKAEKIKHDVSGRIQAYVVRGDGSSMVFGGGRYVTYIDLFED